MREDKAGTARATSLGVVDGEARFLLPPPVDDRGLAVARVARAGAKEPAAVPTAYLARGGRLVPTDGDPDALAAALGTSVLSPSDPHLADVPRTTAREESSLVPWVLAFALLLLPVDTALHRRRLASTKASPSRQKAAA